MLRLLLLAALFCGSLSAETALVLPFFNHSKAANLDWIGESIAESVRDSLVSEGLLVLDREDRLEAYRRCSLAARPRPAHSPPPHNSQTPHPPTPTHYPHPP